MIGTLSPTGYTAGPEMVSAIGPLLAAVLSAAPQDLRDRLGDLASGDAWIYDDWDAARKLAAREGRPVFAVFRCVP